MVLRLVLDQFEFMRFDFGRITNFKLYEEDGTTLFTGTGHTGVIKSFKRHGDRAFFFRDVAKALSVVGILAQVIADVDVTFTTGNHTGTFKWTESLRPSIPGYLWLELQLVKTGVQISSELVRVFIHPSEGQ